jgi:hypothetical protein
MIAPESMMQIVFPDVDMRNYQIILPLGEYVSGTYTLPDNKTWDEYFLLMFISGRTANDMAVTVFPNELFSNAGWTVNPSPESDLYNYATFRHGSEKTFTVNRGGTGAAHMVIGYLK